MNLLQGFPFQIHKQFKALYRLACWKNAFIQNTEIPAVADKAGSKGLINVLFLVINDMTT